MALLLTDYTSFAILRGLLGVAEEEIPDDIFTTMTGTFLLDITMALEDVNASVPTLFETIKNITAGSRSTAQQRYYDIVQLYAAYIVADVIAKGAVEMFAPIKITDGKAEQDRKDPYDSLRTAIAVSLTLWKARLGTALGVLDSTKTVTTVTPTLVTSAGTAIDPVTGV